MREARLCLVALLLAAACACSRRMPQEKIDAGEAAMEAAQLAGADKLTPRSWDAVVKARKALDSAVAKGDAGEAERLAGELMEISSKARAEAMENGRVVDARTQLEACRSSVEAARQALAALPTSRNRATMDAVANLRTRFAGLERDLERLAQAFQGGDLEAVKSGTASVAEAAERLRTDMGNLNRKRRPAQESAPGTPAVPDTPPPPPPTD